MGVEPIHQNIDGVTRNNNNGIHRDDLDKRLG